MHFSVPMIQPKQSNPLTPPDPCSVNHKPVFSIAVRYSTDFCYIVVRIHIPGDKRGGCHLYSAAENEAFKFAW